MIVVLLARDGGEVIDEWFYNSWHNPFTPANLGVEIETTGQDVENLISGGESETLEFKSQLPLEMGQTAIALCAFANAGGGRIIVGVSDNAEIVGCEPNGLREKLANIVRDYCDPAPPFSINSVTAGAKVVVLIDIPEGDDKPYLVRGKGAYLRSGATKRLATRHELDRMYAARDKSRQGPFAVL